MFQGTTRRDGLSTASVNNPWVTAPNLCRFGYLLYVGYLLLASSRRR